MTPHFFYISDIANSSSFNGKIFRKKSMLEKFRANVLKDSLPATLQIITSLMNNSFKSNTFARAWKVAEVTCVPKDGDAGNPCNNRPISLLPVLSKVNERLAHRQFVTFLDNNNKLSQFQSGNSKYHSTETALLSVTDDLLKAMDEKKISILVLMDMSKAFDSINHVIKNWVIV